MECKIVRFLNSSLDVGTSDYKWVFKPSLPLPLERRWWYIPFHFGETSKPKYKMCLCWCSVSVSLPCILLTGMTLIVCWGLTILNNLILIFTILQLYFFFAVFYSSELFVPFVFMSSSKNSWLGKNCWTLWEFDNSIFLHLASLTFSSFKHYLKAGISNMDVDSWNLLWKVLVIRLGPILVFFI